MIVMTMSEVALCDTHFPRRGTIFADAAWILLDDGDLPSNVAWLYDEWINIRSLLRLVTEMTLILSRYTVTFNAETIVSWGSYNLLQDSCNPNGALTSPGTNPHFADITYTLHVHK